MPGLEFYQFKQTIGIMAIQIGVCKTAYLLKMPKSTVCYWKKKLLNPLFHPKKWGGHRWSKFNFVDTIFIRLYLWILVEEDPSLTLQEYASQISAVGFSVSRNYIRRIFRSWKWSWKVPIYKQIAKYTIENISYYGNYLSWILNLPSWLNIKYLDEVHFKNKGKYIYK